MVEYHVTEGQPIAVLLNILLLLMESAVAQWLRCCATIWKVAGSIHAGVTGI